MWISFETNQPHNKRYSPTAIQYPTAYVDVRLEADYKDIKALLCDRTFWAVEFLFLADESIFNLKTRTASQPGNPVPTILQFGYSPSGFFPFPSQSSRRRT